MGWRNAYYADSTNTNGAAGNGSVELNRWLIDPAGANGSLTATTCALHHTPQENASDTEIILDTAPAA
jgi:hypothetical protein